jgi:hypothetical protein
VIIAVTADVEGRGAKLEASGPMAPKPAKMKRKNGSVAQWNRSEGGKGDGRSHPSGALMEAGKTKVLVIGGGSSHNFASSASPTTPRRQRDTPRYRKIATRPRVS